MFYHPPSTRFLGRDEESKMNEIWVCVFVFLDFFFPPGIHHYATAEDQGFFGVFFFFLAVLLVYSQPLIFCRNKGIAT